MMPWRRSRRSPLPCPPPGSTSQPGDALELGWRVHQAQEAWTAKVDVKASIVLALNGAVLAATVSGSNNDSVLSTLTGWREVALRCAIVLVLLGILFAGFVVRPALGPVKVHHANHQDHFIYFGHLRHWNAQQLAARLRILTPHEQCDQVALQLVAMSKRNWWKHRLLQWSLYATILSAVLIAIATAWP